MLKPEKCRNAAQFVRLWVHESLRVFHDRLVTPEDRTMLKGMLSEITSRYFPGSVTPEQFSGKSAIMFADFARLGLEPQSRLYEEVTDRSAFIRSLEKSLDEYNSATATPLNLVFFHDAVEHIVRIGKVHRFCGRWGLV